MVALTYYTTSIGQVGMAIAASDFYKVFLKNHIFKHHFGLDITILRFKIEDLQN